MKANELMIGDWVKFPGGTIDKIVDLPYIEGKGICASFAASATLFPFSVDKIEPIPLTPEILEKNGFKRTQENRWVWEEKYHSNVDIIHIDDCVMFDKEYPSEKNGGLQTGGMIGCMSERGRIDIEGEYVHDLQHALRLCGIKKEIVL